MHHYKLPIFQRMTGENNLFTEKLEDYGCVP